VVVAEQPAAVRVLVESEHVRLLLFVDRADLWPVPKVAAILVPLPGAQAHADVGVRVAPGLPLEVKAVKDGDRLVAGASGAVTFEGWLSEHTLGDVFDRVSWPARDGDTLVREDTRVLAAAGGTQIARFRVSESAKMPAFAFGVDAESGAPPGWQRIRYTNTQVEVRGLVRAVDCKPRGAADRRILEAEGHGGGSGYRSDTRTGVLAPGAAILAPGTQAQVGVVMAPVRVFYAGDSPDGSALQAVDISVWPFGFVHTLVRAADIRSNGLN
jgi:hypothetical protein